MAARSTDNSQQSTNKSSVMAQLLAKQKTTFTPLHRGDIVKGRITKLTRNEMLADINAKSEALIIEKDKRIHRTMLATLKVGDEITATVINPESDMGTPLISLRRFIEGRSWDALEVFAKNHESMDVTISDSTKGGYVVETESGINGFLPHSHTTFPPTQTNVVGKTIQASILEFNKDENKIIFTQKSIISDEDFGKAIKAFKTEQKITATISNITTFGMFVSLPIPENNVSSVKTLDGLIHISEVSWDKVEDLTKLYSVGSTVEAVIIRFDKDAQRVDLSIKRLTEDPFTKISQKYPVEKKVTGKVTKIGSDSITVLLNEEVEAVIRKEKVPPNMTLEVGKTINAVVSEIDNRRHRIILVPVLLEKPIGYR